MGLPLSQKIEWHMLAAKALAFYAEKKMESTPRWPTKETRPHWGQRCSEGTEELAICLPTKTKKERTDWLEAQGEAWIRDFAGAMDRLSEAGYTNGRVVCVRGKRVFTTSRQKAKRLLLLLWLGQRDSAVILSRFTILTNFLSSPAFPAPPEIIPTAKTVRTRGAAASSCLARSLVAGEGPMRVAASRVRFCLTRKTDHKA